MKHSRNNNKIHAEGSYMDGMRLSNVTVSDLLIHSGKDAGFRIASLESSNHSGGVNLFGKNFGNYDQDIKYRCITIRYKVNKNFMQWNLCCKFFVVKSLQ